MKISLMAAAASAACMVAAPANAAVTVIAQVPIVVPVGSSFVIGNDDFFSTIIIRSFDYQVAGKGNFYSYPGTSTQVTEPVGTLDPTPFIAKSAYHFARIRLGFDLLGNGGSGLDSFTISNIVVESDQPFGFGVNRGIPEPATWALMILGFGAVAGALRRRRQRPAVA